VRRATVLLMGAFLCGTSLGRDLTFFVWSDTHFGACDRSHMTQRRIIEQMNRLPGTPYPEGVFEGEAVGKPAFLLHLGDITENGLPSEWDDPTSADHRSYIQTIRHLTATEMTCEAIGNHDSRMHPNIRRQIARKHGGTYYSFDVEGVHFVVLDAYTNRNPAVAHLGEKQLEWLRADLAVVGGGRPVIIAMHAGPPRRSISGNGSRAVDNSVECLWSIVADTNVIAFLHGHLHAASRGRWFEFDTVAPAGLAYKRRGCAHGQPVFGVVRITSNRMVVLGWDWEKERFLSHRIFEKSFSEGSASGRPTAEAAR